MPDARRSYEPEDRLTEIANTALEAVEHEKGVRVIVLVDDDDRGGTGMHGYESDFDALAAMLAHAQAILETHGMGLTILTAPRNDGSL